MHKFLRAVGFSSCKTRKELKALLSRVENEAKTVRIVQDENGDTLVQKVAYVGRRLGISLCGVMDDEDKFEGEFYFPWHEANCISSQAPCQIQRHAEKTAFSGICEELGLGVSMIFYLQNQLDYLERDLNHQRFCYVTSVMMSGLSVQGKILLPARDNPESKVSMLQSPDIYTLVETTFMPFGVECDQYAVIGEIAEVEEVTNDWTGERIYSLTLKCNGLTFQVCINSADLMGEPAPGRRFKGAIWMQGIANFSESVSILQKTQSK